MEIVHAHIVAKLNFTTTDFQQKTKVDNPLQYIKLNPPKMSIVTNLIYGEVVCYQKTM
jgi:hypothetical protein